MSNDEVERLRKLRACALRVRAIAQALETTQTQPLIGDWLRRIAAATWRVSRAVSGQLRAHPYATFQKDAGMLTLLVNSLRASAVARCFGRHARAVSYIAAELATLSRLLDDARALTGTLTLSDSFGRSQLEIRTLLAEYGGRSRVPAPLPALVLQTRSGSMVAAESDWPYLNL
jgi:hypothetical protein